MISDNHADAVRSKLRNIILALSTLIADSDMGGSVHSVLNEADSPFQAVRGACISLLLPHNTGYGAGLWL